MSPSNSDVIERRSEHDFAETVRRLDRALTARGVPVFARIDHAANAEAVGLSMPPALVVIFGNALAGTPVMLQAPGSALDLPLRILVRQDAGGAVVVSHHDPVAVVAAFGLPPETAGSLRAVEAIATEAAGP